MKNKIKADDRERES